MSGDEIAKDLLGDGEPSELVVEMARRLGVDPERLGEHLRFVVAIAEGAAYRRVAEAIAADPNARTIGALPAREFGVTLVGWCQVAHAVAEDANADITLSAVGDALQAAMAARKDPG